MAIGLGTASSISIPTAGFTASILSMNQSDLSRESIDTSHLGTTTARTFTPSTLIDSGTVELEFQMEMDTVQTTNVDTLINAVAETITITFTNGATVAGSGFCTNVSFSVPLEELVTGTVTIKWSGDLTWTNG